VLAVDENGPVRGLVHDGEEAPDLLGSCHLPRGNVHVPYPGRIERSALGSNGILEVLALLRVLACGVAQIDHRPNAEIGGHVDQPRGRHRGRAVEAPAGDRQETVVDAHPVGIGRHADRCDCGERTDASQNRAS